MITKNVRILLVISGVLLGAIKSEAGLKIYYIRHANAGHNVVNDWKKRGIPKDEWPAYVGNPNMFTPKGLAQQAAAVEKLKQYKIDFIASSHFWRVRNTILPYLKATGSRAEIWPELREHHADELILSTELPVPTEAIIGKGKKVEVPADEAAWFCIIKGEEREYKLPKGKGEEYSAGTSRVVMNHVINMIQTRFGGTDKSILLAGHNGSGKALLRMLTNDPQKGVSFLNNTGVWMVEEQADGTFKLMMFNDLPVVNGKIVPAQAQ